MAAALGTFFTHVHPRILAKSSRELEIDPTTINAAERIFDFELTQDERNRIVEGLTKNREAFRDLRGESIGLDEFPSNVFTPRHYRRDNETRELTPVYSRVEPKVPKSIENVAFYSILELAALIRNKIISSREKPPLS